MKKIKMIGLDLDGTLLNDKKELTSHTREILTRAIDQGVTVLAATGRPVTGIPEVLRNFPGMRYALTSNGGRILDLQEDKILYATCCHMRWARRSLRFLETMIRSRRSILMEEVSYRRDELLKSESICGILRWQIISEPPAKALRVSGRRWKR